MRNLGAERGRETRAERALIARGDEGARLVDRKAVPGGEADLRQFVGDDGVGRQHLAQDVQVRHLRLDLLDLLLRRRGGLADRGAAAAGLAVAGLSHRGDQIGGAGLGIRDHGGVRRASRRISDGSISIRIGFQALRLIGPAESGCRQFHPRADPDHQIGVRPKLVGRRHGQPEFMRVGDDAAAAAERHDRRVDHLGEFEDFLARMDRAAADEDHRPLAALDQCGRRLDAVRIGLRGGKGSNDLGRADLRALGEHVPRHFQRNRAAAARQHFLKRARHHARAPCRDIRCGRPISRRCAASPAGPASRADGRGPCREIASAPGRSGTAPARCSRRRSAAPRSALSTPGPGTTLNTPGLPVDRA